MSRQDKVSSLTLLLFAAGVVTAMRDDPRCEGVTGCSVLAQPYNFPSNFATDPTTCQNRTYCPQCLSGPLWEQRLQDLGAGNALRTIHPFLVINNWLSSEIPDTIAMILLKETMRVNVDTVPMAIDGTGEILCCDEFLVELEKW